jgi:asparagine synthase (glutamine-hydrolysing)
LLSSEISGMKLQLGLLHTDGRPATRDDLSNLLGEFAGTRAETSGEIHDGSLLMAYRGDRITNEEHSEAQPLCDEPYVLTFDGRLDNREELAKRLGFPHLETIPDPVLVLKYYEAFGESAFADLIGEFALVLWCQKSKSLLLARSTCGARPLYYLLIKHALIWSSDFAHLVRISAVDLDVNEKYFIEYLLSQPSTNHTPLSRVDVVPNNTLIRFEDGRIQSQRKLWNPSSIASLNYKSDQEYEEHCRERVTEAVRVRLRSRFPVFAELSGGFDSSSVVLTADEVLKAKNQPTTDLRTVSCIYEQSKTCDESLFIRAVEDKRGIETLRVWEKDQGITLGLHNPRFTGLPNPLHCSPGRYPTFASLMREHKSSLLLTGIGGDHLFWSVPDGTPIIADEICEGNLLRAHQLCSTWSRYAGVPYLRLAGRATRLAAGSLYQRPEVPNWLGLKLKTTISEEEVDFPGYKTGGGIPSWRSKLFSLDLLFRDTSAGHFNEYRDLYVSHPYTHRPLLEFCLAGPLSQFLRNGQTRSLMRRALTDLLPVKIVKRVSKGEVDEAIIRALHREWTSTASVKKWRVCEFGLVEAGSLLDSLEEMRLGIQHLNSALLRLFSLERWLRSLSDVPAQGLVRHNTRVLPGVVCA